MKSNFDKKKVVQSLSVLVMGVFLTGGGLFLWQNKFDLSFFSSASTSSIQAIVCLGEKRNEGIPSYATAVNELLTPKQAKTIELIDRSDTGSTISALRDQAVLGYNDITKPITNHVVFLVVTGRNTINEGIQNKATISAISTQISTEISKLIELTTARPGVFPSGFTVYLATIPDPLDKTGDATLCKGTMQNYGKEYTKGVFKEVNATIKSMGTIYPQYIKIVDLEKIFLNHGVTNTNSWYSNCDEMNTLGKQAVTNAFSQAVQDVK